MKQKKIWIFLGLVILIYILNRIFGWSSYLRRTDNLSFLMEMIEKNLAKAILIYMIITITGSVLLALPGVTFAILAGLLFGPFLGTAVCVIAATMGAVLAFLAGRFFLRDSIRPVAVKNKYLKKWLFDETGRNQLFVLMITRLVPLFPYNLQNFAYGVTDIGGITYTVGSFLFMIPGTAMYTIGTAGIADSRNRFPYLSAAFVIAVAVILGGLFLKKKYMGEENDKGQ